MRRTLAAGSLTVVALAAAAAGVGAWRSARVGLVQRGAAVAAARGCLACHGAAGREVDPERGLGGAPTFGHDDVTAYAHDESELREWILDGRPRRVREQNRGEEPPLLRMPAWRGVLSPRELEALVAWIQATSDFAPIPESARAGRELAGRLGCFSCHGPQGRGDTPNPGSLKGYIPSWSGADFAELVRDEAELAEWIRDGSPRRLREHPIARFFMSRQAIRMPAYGARLSRAEMEDIARYIRWLRQPPGAAARASAPFPP